MGGAEPVVVDMSIMTVFCYVWCLPCCLDLGRVGGGSCAGRLV